MKNPKNEDDDKRVLRYIEERKGVTFDSIHRMLFIGALRTDRRADNALRRLKKKGLIEYRREGRNGSAWYPVGGVK